MAVYNNVYVHSNPPKAISGQGAAIRQWVKNGEVEKLENVVLEGQGARLLGLMEATSDPKLKGFLRSIPSYMAKVDLIHEAVIRGSLRETQALLDKRKLATAKDAVGRSLAHKAVLYYHKGIVEWLGKRYPETLHLKDNESRTCLHYSASSKEPEEMHDLLISLGANPNQIDIHGRKPIYYLQHPEELDIEGPRNWSRGKRRKISPIYPKSMSPTGSITRAQVRIWIHERDITKLETILWSGQGEKLLLETTNNSRVRKFLDNVPHVLSSIKNIHGSAINNDIESVREMKRRTDIHELFSAKDSHGLTPLHKAAGLGNRLALEYFLKDNPEMINEPDNYGLTPLHYAAGLRDGSTYTFLIRNGADENLADIKGKTPDYYRIHPGELDGRNLRFIPDAPRVQGEITGWDRFSPVGHMGVKRRISSGEFSGPGISEETPAVLNGKLEYDDLKDEFLFDAEDVKMSKKDVPQEENLFNMNNASNYGEVKGEIMLSAEPESIRKGVEMENNDMNPQEALPEDYGIPQDRSLKYSTKYRNQRQPRSTMAQTPKELEKATDQNMPEDLIAGELQSQLPSGVFHNEDEQRDERDDKIIEGMNDQNPKEQTQNDEEQEMNEGKIEGMMEENIEEAPQEIKNELDGEEELQSHLASGDMEKLVDYVLDGRGMLLVGRTSANSEVQEFLNNIPAYIVKIANIHRASATGNLRDLQSLLDRKRLAFSRDEDGLCPIHKAVLNNHPSVVRYLASNYPQSIELQDKNGRTALHYASVTPDSGVMYKALIQAGANPNVKDNRANTPGTYLRNKELLKISDLFPSKKVEVWQRPPSPLPPPPPSQLGDGSQKAEEVDLKEGQIPIVDIPSKFVTQVRIRLSRNIDPFPFVTSMGKDDLEEVNWRVKSIEPLDWVELQGLDKINLDWMPTATKISRFWPKFRSYARTSDNIIIWINGMDHLDFVIHSQYGRLYPMFLHLFNFYKRFNKLNFHWNEENGFLTVNPFNSGSGMKITFRIRLPTLMKDPRELKRRCGEMRLTIKWKNNTNKFRYKSTEIEPEDWVELENLRTIGNEIDIARETVEAVLNLIDLEEKVAKN